MRILGLDFGSRTVGVAVSDPTGLISQGVEVIRRSDEKSVNTSVSRIKELLRLYDTDMIVLGYPKNMNNTEGERCEKTLAFKAKLEKSIKDIHVILVDERLSTVAAERSLLEADLSRAKRNKVIDKMAAVNILQGYLDAERKKKSEDIHKMDKDEFNFDEFEDDDLEVIILNGEDGESIECFVISALEHNGITYLLVIDKDEFEDEDGEAFIIKEISTENDEVVYEEIMDDNEFDEISALFAEDNDEFELQ